MTDLARLVLASFEASSNTLALQLGDIKNEDAVRRARGGSGSSISWIIGHLLDFRCSLLKACGVDRPNPYAQKFSNQTPATDGSGYPSISELWNDWRQIHNDLQQAISRLTDEQLKAETELPSPDPQKTLLAALNFYAFHEAYHVGAVGILRVAWGYRQTHEVAMERMKQKPRKGAKTQKVQSREP